MTGWAKQRLEELLSNMAFIIPNTNDLIEVKKVKDLEGDAAITFTRGKKKFLFDFSFVLDWEVELDCGPAKGTLRYPDVTPDSDGDYDTILEVRRRWWSPFPCVGSGGLCSLLISIVLP